jgi:DNA-binding NarL/FixJ family response regulator
VSTRILVADDHGLLRAGLRTLLNAEPDLEVVGEAADGEETQRLTREFQPDVVLMDVSMPGCGGIETTRRLVELCSAVRVLILTVHEDTGLLQAAIRAGAAGYILKRAVEAELVSAIRAVARGDLYVHPSMTRALLTDVAMVPSATRVGTETHTARGTHTPHETLTPREVEVLGLIARGHTNRQIADFLTLSVRTVESHRANLMDKLDLRSRVELVHYAMDNALL